MKRKSMFLIAVLLSLYVMPLVFAPSYASSADPNMAKDFSIAEEWYDDSWLYRKLITIDGGEVATEPYYQVQISVTYDGGMQNDFDDVIFTDNDKVTLLDFWRESYVASTSAVFWVEIADVISKGVEHDGAVTYINMYFGNAGVSTTSDGEATFLFYEDWSSQSIDAWTVPAGQADGQTTFDVEDAEHGGYVAEIEADEDDSYLIHSDFTYLAPFAVMFRANIEETTSGDTARVGTGWAGAYGWAFMQGAAGTEIFNVYDDDANDDPQSMDATYYDVWTTFQITRDGTNVKLYADTALIETASFDPDEVENPVFSFQNTNNDDDIYSDWVACRKFVTDEPAVDSFGEKEYRFPPAWNEAGEAEVIFSVAIDETGLDLLLIFLGLCMIPFSMLYMVKGGTSEMSTNKFFFGLILFFLGWGLFIGGIF